MLRQWRRSEFKMRDRTVGVIDAGNVGGMEGSAPPKLSVCIDAREDLEHLEGCIRSVLGQTFTDIEIVVGVCCESESTFESALRQGGGDPRFRFQRHASHRSAVQRWNDCLAIVRGDYVKLLPAHTYLTTPDTLARFVAALDRNPAISVVAAAAQFEGRTAFDLAQEVSAISVVAAAAQFEGAETHPAEKPFRLVRFLTASIGQFVALAAAEILRARGKVQLARPAVEGDSAHDQRADEPPAPAAELRRRRF